jgi:hypothetical protein
VAKKGKKDLETYSPTADKRMVTATPVGADGVLITQTTFFALNADTEKFLCDAAHYYYIEDSVFFPFEKCYDSTDPEGIYDFDNMVGFAKLSIEGGVSFPADGISVT